MQPTVQPPLTKIMNFLVDTLEQKEANIRPRTIWLQAFFKPLYLSEQMNIEL